jgi:hypothetical protein
MDAVALGLGMLLPLAAGMAILLAACRDTRALERPGELAWLAGAGHLVGVAVLTTWMHALATIGVPFGRMAIAGPILAAAVVLGWIGWRRHGAILRGALRNALRAIVRPPDLSAAARAAWWALLAWMALRFALLGLEVAWRPLYPWDAWTQWATKARVWYELGRIVSFSATDAWLASAGASYFDAAPAHPPLLPLLQVWTCVALGRWDDALMNGPWWQFAAALALAVYGALRSLQLAPLGALAASFLVSSLPLANVHVALAGYAELPIAACYTAAVLALLRWHAWRCIDDAALAALLALACAQIGAPGSAWALSLAAGVLVALLPRHGLRLVAAGLGVALFVVVALTQTHLPFGGRPLHLEFAPPWPALGQSFFLLANWHLLWYGVLATLPFAWRELVAPSLAPLTAIVATALVLLFVLIGFPDARAWLAGATTPNRLALEVAPLLAVFVAFAWHDFAARWAAAHLAEPPPGGDAQPLPAVTTSAEPQSSPAARPADGAPPS